MLVKAARDPSSGGDVTGENGPATESEPVTYALMPSFSHASSGIGHSPWGGLS